MEWIQMESHLYDNHLTAINYTVAGILVLLLVVQWHRTATARLDLPVVGDISQKDFRPALEEGAQKYPNTPFVLATTMHPTVILPVSLMDEIKGLPESTISLRQRHYTIFLGKYTGFGEPCNELDVSIRSDLTHHLEQNLENFQEEVAYAYDKYVGQCPDWTVIPVYDAVLGIVCLLSSRVFVGLPLSRDEDWIRVSTHSDTKSDTQSGDLMRYVLRHYESEPPMELLARDQLVTSFVAMHTTTICITQALFDLAARPEYIPSLREELEGVIGKGGTQDCYLDKESVVKLRKIDSVVRESQRMNPPGLVSMLRKVMKRDGLKLSTGQIIPQGSVVGFSAHAISRSYPNADEFDGFLFAKLRDTPVQSTMHQLTNTAPDHISFGHGSHACPGRFFAASEIKVILGYLLQNYDIRLLDGATRLESVHVRATVAPARENNFFPPKNDNKYQQGRPPRR
ncbi:uncharacterized protein N7487_003556 [Penicillium crustosum]|uniref:uncharacterized protein n=1 Tax=Penicillium crustosum TaxID=36656 RepID=UPI00239B34D0|nr:uncharacterized protein N7487_003556 [Penicillium crustosum]KAJ5409197.1 hypothetical protein N7487_003556 [Penicillium crustosum]